MKKYLAKNRHLILAGIALTAFAVPHTYEIRKYFAGGCAGEILFERKSLFRDTAQGREAWEETPGSAAQGIDPAVAGGGYSRGDNA